MTACLPSLVPVGFAAVVSFHEVIALFHHALDVFDEFFTALGHSAEGDDGVAFGEIISDRKGLAVGFEAVGGAFDEVIGGFAFS